MKKISDLLLRQGARKQAKKKETFLHKKKKKQTDSFYEEDLQELLEKLGVKSGRSRFYFLFQQLVSLIAVLLICAILLLAFSEPARMKLWHVFFQGLAPIQMDIRKQPGQNPAVESFCSHTFRSCLDKLSANIRKNRFPLFPEYQRGYFLFRAAHSVPSRKFLFFFTVWQRDYGFGRLSCFIRRPCQTGQYAGLCCLLIDTPFKAKPPYRFCCRG